MDAKTWIGSLAEAKAAAALVERGFDVFRSLSGKAPFDLVAFRDGQLLRVEVKGTAGSTPERGAYRIKLSSTRSNRSGNRTYTFDARKSDLLAVYVWPTDSVCFFASRLLQGRRCLFLRESPNRTTNKLKSWLIQDYLEIPPMDQLGVGFAARLVKEGYANW